MKAKYRYWTENWHEGDKHWRFGFGFTTEESARRLAQSTVNRLGGKAKIRIWFENKVIAVIKPSQKGS